MEALKQLKEQYECMTKGKIVTKNGIFLDNSFQPNAEFYKKVQYGGASMYKLDFARNPDLSRIILDSWLSNGKETPLGNDLILKLRHSVRKTHFRIGCLQNGGAYEY